MILFFWTILDHDYVEIKDRYCSPHNIGGLPTATTLTQAKLQCKSNGKERCGYVYDYGCRGEEFFICAMGSAERHSKMGSCLHKRKRLDGTY